jgi:hypothetical protein
MEEKTSREPISRPGEPTTAAPGSARKIRVLMERAARKESLFHPLDGVRRSAANPITTLALAALTGQEIPPEGPEMRSA